MIPEKIKNVLDVLNKAGYEAYIVGGAVRDMVLNVEPHDWDITTNAKPDEIKKVFAKTIDTGLKHGTVTAMIDNEGFEITTYRIDGEYSDGRHPDEVIFTTDLIEDLKRRDLTINAMACDKDGKIIDPFNGQDDLKKGIIRAVGNAEDRVREDALRMMRAIRFSAKLGYDIDKDLIIAIKNNAKLIEQVSYERIESETTKIITSDHPEKFIELYNLGLTKYIMPEFDKCMECEQNTPWHLYNVGIHTIESMKNIPNDKVLRWTMLLHDIGKPEVKSTNEKGQDHFFQHNVESKKIATKILDRYHFSNNESKQILNLVDQHDLHLKKDKKVREFVAKYGVNFVEQLKYVQLADMAGQSDYKKDEKMETFNVMFDKCEKFIEDKTAITLKELKINGNDLIDIGFKGKEIGEVLNSLYSDALCDPNLNNKEKLKNKALKIFQTKNSLDSIIENAKKDYNSEINNDKLIQENISR